MGCPIHGIDYKEIGDKAICPKCGRARGYKQLDWVQILTENKELKQENEKLKYTISLMNKEISHNAPRTTQD